MKSSISEGLTKKDLVKMSPQQILNAARNGDAIAQLWLGDAIYKGTFPNWDEFESCEWYYRSALQDNAEAAFKLHEDIPFAKRKKVCQYIKGVGKTNLDSDFWLHKSARLNYGPAQFRLFQTSINKKTKLKWIRKAVESDYIPAIIWFGKMHLKEWSVKKNVKKAIALFKKASILEIKKGVPINVLGKKDIPADFELAVIYSNEKYLNILSGYEGDLLVEKIKNMDAKTKKRLQMVDYSNFFNMEKAVSSAKKCVQKNISFACYMSLIQYHTHSHFNYIDYDEALFWLEEAESVLKNDKAYHQILFQRGYAHLTWPNVKKNKVKAREYFQKAIESGKSGFMMNSTQKFYEDMIQRTY